MEVEKAENWFRFNMKTVEYSRVAENGNEFLVSEDKYPQGQRLSQPCAAPGLPRKSNKGRISAVTAAFN